MVAGCDRTAPAKTPSFPVYASLDALLDAQAVDVAVIATPPETHAALARTCLERGVHVLCEKPFTPTIDEGIELVRLADAKGLRIAVNNEFRFMRCHAAAQAQIGQPAFGELQFVQMNQTFRTSAHTEAGCAATIPSRLQGVRHPRVRSGALLLRLQPLRLFARMPRPRIGGPRPRSI